MAFLVMDLINKDLVGVKENEELLSLSIQLLGMEFDLSNILKNKNLN